MVYLHHRLLQVQMFLTASGENGSGPLPVGTVGAGPRLAPERGGVSNLAARWGSILLYTTIEQILDST